MLNLHNWIVKCSEYADTISHSQLADVDTSVETRESFCKLLGIIDALASVVLLGCKYELPSHQTLTNIITNPPTSHWHHLIVLAPSL